MMAPQTGNYPVHGNMNCYTTDPDRLNRLLQSVSEGLIKEFQRMLEQELNRIASLETAAPLSAERHGELIDHVVRAYGSDDLCRALRAEIRRTRARLLNSKLERFKHSLRVMNQIVQNGQR